MSSHQRLDQISESEQQNTAEEIRRLREQGTPAALSDDLLDEVAGGDWTHTNSGVTHTSSGSPALK